MPNVLRLLCDMKDFLHQLICKEFFFKVNQINNFLPKEMAPLNILFTNKIFWDIYKKKGIGV